MDIKPLTKVTVKVILIVNEAHGNNPASSSTNTGMTGGLSSQSGPVDVSVTFLSNSYSKVAFSWKTRSRLSISPLTIQITSQKVGIVQ